MDDSDRLVIAMEEHRLQLASSPSPSTSPEPMMPTTPKKTSSPRSSPARSACHVCGEDISELNQQIHYGAIACFSCRAFFRRAQGAKRPFQACKKENNCELTVDTRRFCGSCRWVYLIRASYKLDAPLNILQINCATHFPPFIWSAMSS